MDMKVSIIVPVYNVAAYLEACLLSCINQTFRDIEIIVVDDGSTDESPGIIKRYAEKDDRIKVIAKENQGLIYARKSGLEAACGEYVFHLDGDDYLEVNAIEVLYREIIESGSDYAECGYYFVSEDDGCICKQKIKGNSLLKGLSGEDLLFYALHHNRWSIWGKLMRKSLFDGIVYFPVSLGEDLFLLMQICLKVKKSIVVDICLYNYVSRPGSITNQKEVYRKRRLDMIKSIFFLLDRYAYSQLVREEVYLMFYYYFLNGIYRKEIEVKTILYDYYWSKEEQRAFLWRRRKDFYLITGVFFLCPFVGRLILKIYLPVIFLWRKFLGHWNKRFKRS